MQLIARLLQSHMLLGHMNGQDWMRFIRWPVERLASTGPCRLDPLMTRSRFASGALGPEAERL